MKSNLFLKTKKSLIISSCTVILASILASASAANDKSDSALLDDFIKSKGYSSIISFDSSNIKQYWISNEVCSIDDSIVIVLPSEKLESTPLKIQLANVDELMDCKVTVYTKEQDVTFSVLDSSLNKLSQSTAEDSFIHYNIFSSVFHIEDLSNNSFNLMFSSKDSSKNSNKISIKKITLSFTKNSTSKYLASPGKVSFSFDDMKATPENKSELTSVDKDHTSMTGTYTMLAPEKSIIVSDKPVTSSVTIKNIGETSTYIYWGFRVFSKDKMLFAANNYPFSENSKVLTVVSSQKDSDTIIVDSYSDWKKGSFLALNVKEDMSDIPNTAFVGGTILDVKESEDGHAEIKMSKPLKDEIRKGTKVRIHGTDTSAIYMETVVLKPGEEKVFSSEISKDNNWLVYSKKAFPRGVYCIKPIIISISVDQKEKNTVLISDFNVSY